MRSSRFLLISETGLILGEGLGFRGRVSFQKEDEMCRKGSGHQKDHDGQSLRDKSGSQAASGNGIGYLGIQSDLGPWQRLKTFQKPIEVCRAIE